jgi:hypothetical protein
MQELGTFRSVFPITIFQIELKREGQSGSKSRYKTTQLNQCLTISAGHQTLDDSPEVLASYKVCTGVIYARHRKCVIYGIIIQMCITYSSHWVGSHHTPFQKVPSASGFAI